MLDVQHASNSSATYGIDASRQHCSHCNYVIAVSEAHARQNGSAEQLRLNVSQPLQIPRGARLQL
jgi:outer membrane usher protein FimD/PapC